MHGITLWGYRPGHWRTAQGAYIAHDNGAERPALVWLIDYVAQTALRPWITAHPAPQQTATVGDTVTFSCAGNGTAPLAYQWRKDGAPIVGNPSATTATLALTGILTADAGELRLRGFEQRGQRDESCRHAGREQSGGGGGRSPA